MVRMIRSLFHQALKTNNSLEFAVLTGCMRISKESIFTGLNNLEVQSISDEIYDEYFGFTDAEVRDMLEYYEKSEYFGKVKQWYDGYRFGETDKLVDEEYRTILKYGMAFYRKECRVRSSGKA